MKFHSSCLCAREAYVFDDYSALATQLFGLGCELLNLRFTCFNKNAIRSVCVGAAPFAYAADGDIVQVFCVPFWQTFACKCFFRAPSAFATNLLVITFNGTLITAASKQWMHNQLITNSHLVTKLNALRTQHLTPNTTTTGWSYAARDNN